MKKRIRFISLILSMMVMLSIVSCICTSALINYTPTRMMNGYSLRGYTSLGSNVASSGTYCENVSYGKRVLMFTRYYNSAGASKHKWSPNTDYIVNGLDTITSDAYGATLGGNIYESTGYHWVRASAHMYWSSDESGENTFVTIN